MAPMALMAAGFGFASPLTLSIAMIWLAHIGFDRALGYGLKYSAGFGFTHLGRIGKDAAKADMNICPSLIPGILERSPDAGEIPLPL